jgi:hypothetical protein
LQNQTKIQDLIIVITYATTQSLYTASILMVVGHQRTGRKTSEGLRTKETQGLSMKDPLIQPKRRSFEPWLRARPRPIHNETSILHVPWKRHQPSHKRLPHLPCDQKKNGARFGTTFAPTRTLRNQSTMQLAPHHQQYSPSYPPHFLAQAYQNSQTQPLTYYQSYHYATTNHPQPPASYSYSVASKKPETLRRASRQDTKMYTFCESS